jgi:copper homeostasis protein
MPGSGVRSDNVEKLVKKTNATEFHTSARTYTDSKMEFINESMDEQLTSVTTLSNEIKTIIQLLKAY